MAVLTHNLVDSYRDLVRRKREAAHGPGRP
jgi:hypothetical protein